MLNACSALKPQAESDITVFKGPFATVDFSDRPELLQYSPFLNRQIMFGPNYAGHYFVALMSCGDQCRDYTVVDLVTGRIKGTFKTCAPAEFSVDSYRLATPKTAQCSALLFDISSGEFVFVQ